MPLQYPQTLSDKDLYQSRHDGSQRKHAEGFFINNVDRPEQKLTVVLKKTITLIIIIILFIIAYFYNLPIYAQGNI